MSRDCELKRATSEYRVAHLFALVEQVVACTSSFLIPSHVLCNSPRFAFIQYLFRCSGRCCGASYSTTAFTTNCRSTSSRARQEAKVPKTCRSRHLSAKLEGSGSGISESKTRFPDLALLVIERMYPLDIADNIREPSSGAPQS